MSNNKKRIELLSPSEIDFLYACPQFNANERELYFSFTKDELEIIHQLNGVNTKLNLMIKLGYFKAKLLFFKFDDINHEDCIYLKQKYFSGKDIEFKQIDGRTDKKLREIVFGLLNYTDYKNNISPVKQQLQMLVRHYPKPHNVIKELLQYFNNKNIMLPPYRTLQDLYTEAHAQEMQRLSQLVRDIPIDVKQQITTLINCDEEGLNSLNSLRYDQADFNYTAMINEVCKVNELSEIYHYATSFLDKTLLSKNAIDYYNQLVEQYPISRLRKMNADIQIVYAICFIYHRYHIFCDHLTVSFMHNTAILEAMAKDYVKEQHAKYAANIVEKYSSLAAFFNWFPQQEKRKKSFEKFYQEAYEILSKKDFEKFAKYFDGKDFDAKCEKWQFYQNQSQFIARNLRPVILALDFEHYKQDHQVGHLLRILKDHYQKKRTPGQLKLTDDIGMSIPAAMAPYLKEHPNDKYLNPHRFEIYVYEKVHHYLKRGTMACKTSKSHRDIDDDLVADSLVDKADQIASQFGYSKIADYCGKRLDDLLTMLDETWERVTNNIESGKNLNINITYNNGGEPSWQLDYDTSPKLDDSFFKGLPKIDIADIFSFINDTSDVYKGFEHIRERYVKRQKPTVLAITACVLSDAFGFGIGKMSEMSDLSFAKLRAVHGDFIRYETLDKVNDLVSNFVCDLPIFKAWNLLYDKLLADIDGQKEATKSNTIQSRYSKKYLGKGKGISILSLIVNFIAASVKNIGLNEYEGHHLYDMVYDNKSDINIQAITGDGHSVNKLNHVVLDAIDVEFVPSIKKITSEATELYCLQNKDKYTGVIKPKDSINVDLIKKHKRGITRVLLSLILQENTQSTIIRKLNSHARYAGLRAAFYEYNKIFNSIHVLNMIDSLPLRKAVRTARNRTESYHQLQRFIRNMYQGVFRGKRIINHSVTTQAVRLVSNIIVAYNSIILNKLYEKMKTSDATEDEINKFLKISPMAWIHIAFTGRYTFNGKGHQINLEEIIRVLEVNLKKIMSNRISG